MPSVINMDVYCVVTTGTIKSQVLLRKGRENQRGAFDVPLATMDLRIRYVRRQASNMPSLLVSSLLGLKLRPITLSLKPLSGERG